MSKAEQLILIKCNMTSEHNPIAELIHQIQTKWKNEVSGQSECKLVRWLIKPEEARLYEGFLKLESTEHGSIPEVLVTMLSPFKNRQDYSTDLIRDWITTFREDAKTQEKLKAKDKTINWDNGAFLTTANNSDEYNHGQLLTMLSSFRLAAAKNEVPLVVALFPHWISDMEDFRMWLIHLLKMEIPDGISFLIFDHIGQNYFEGVCKKFPEITKTLHINLDMDGAISKIAKMGNPNSPEVRLRECILEMGKCVQNKDRSRLEKWGEKALEVTKRSNSKSMYASAHIIYAGMLFNFKAFDKIDALLTNGLTIVNQGLTTEPEACIPLIIQYYGFMAASKQHQRRIKEAIHIYEKQADTAVTYSLPGMSLTPYQQAYTLSKKHLPERYEELLKKAYGVGRQMQNDEQKNSSFPSIALDYLEWLESRKHNEATVTDDELTTLFGAGWKSQAKKPGSPFNTDTQKTIILT
jgi:hypothetical protein